MSNTGPFMMDELIECAEREVRMREYVYPGRVKSQKMSQQKADRELALMRAIVRELQRRV